MQISIHSSILTKQSRANILLPSNWAWQWTTASWQTWGRSPPRIKASSHSAQSAAPGRGEGTRKDVLSLCQTQCQPTLMLLICVFTLSIHSLCILCANHLNTVGFPTLLCKCSVLMFTRLAPTFLLFAGMEVELLKYSINSSSTIYIYIYILLCHKRLCPGRAYIPIKWL